MSDSRTPIKQTTWQTALKNKLVIAYCVYVSIAVFPTGFDPSMLLPLPLFRKQFGYEYQGDYVISTTHQAIWNCVLLPGGILGSMIAGPIGSFLGRKYVFIVGSVIMAAAIVQLQITSDWRIITSGKLFYYTGYSVYLVGASTYISEIAPPGIRGVMLSLINLSMFIWQFICSCVLQGTQSMDSNLSFRIPIIMQYIVPLIFLTCTWFIPETPYWLVENNKLDAAKESLKRLHGAGGNHDFDQDLKEIKNTIDQQKASNVTYLDCFRGSNLRRTMIAAGILAAQPLVGGVFVFSYTTYFFILSGVEQTQAFNITAVMFALQIIANILSWPLIERFGRRFLLLTGTTILLISNLIIGGIGASGIGAGDIDSSGPMPKVVVSFMVIFSVFFQLSVGAAGWAVASEVSSTKMRALTQSIATASFSIFCFAIYFTVPYLINPDGANLGPKVCFIYGSFTLLTILFIYFEVPEMKGRTYDELDYMFQHRIPARKFKGYMLPEAGTVEARSSSEKIRSSDIEEVGL